jgi:hypothetical protein
MAASGFTPISLYYSTTPTAQPVNTNLVQGELALNIYDGKLYYKDNANVVQLLAAKGGNGVSTFSAGSTGLTPNTPTSGAIVLAGTLGTGYGGTGLTAFVADQIFFAGTTSTVDQSADLTWDGSTLGVTGVLTVSADSSFNSTGALLISRGATGDQPASPVEGMLRYNTDNKQFEGYSEVGAVPGWYSVGGSAIVNDTTTATELYPLFASATSGTAQTVYTSDAKYLYKPSTGELQANEVVASNGFLVNSDSVASDYTVGTGFNAVSVGPVTVQSGISVTVSSGQRWVIL